MRNRTLTFFAAVLLAMIAIEGTADAATIVTFHEHNLNATLNIPSHSIELTDKTTATVKEGWNYFYISSDAKLSKLTLADKTVELSSYSISDSLKIRDELKTEIVFSDLSGEPGVVLFQSRNGGKMPLTVSYKAEMFQDVSNVRFSRENVGREVNGTIEERGTYLSPGAYYYPTGDEELATYSITASVPMGWRTVSDGNQIFSRQEGERLIESWSNPFLSDGLMFMAAPYVEVADTVLGVEIVCLFFPEDSSLAEGYLEATAGYMEMYDSLIGPYPYQRFTIAENFFPTGYGMPGWTLLGQQVLRLPFIKYTSLGHEVLHNWWGNSVYVDYERGNWCEAATVYGADYRYKLMRSPDAAKAYRKDILKEYVSYVSEGNDFPIRDFTSRTSANTRTIGYNKAMMVYHMIEQEIGEESFFAAWRSIYDQKRMQRISWEEWIDAFESTSKKDLSWVIPEWIDRTGAPVLAIEEIKEVDNQDPEMQTFQLILSQSGEDIYRLNVPVRVTAPIGGLDASSMLSGLELSTDINFLLEKSTDTFSFDMPIPINSISVDPDYHLFRRLYPEEIEPIVSAVMGANSFEFVSSESSSDLLGFYQEFAENLIGDSIVIKKELTQSSEEGSAVVLLNPEKLPSGLSELMTVTDDSIGINGETYPREGHSFVLSTAGFSGYERAMVIISDDPASLPRIGQLVPHYGKYSFLVFEGARNVGKGQWEVTSSPLKREL